MTKDSTKVGLFAALASYSIWGLIALYWRLMAEATSVEILAHRIVWSFVFIIGILLFQRQIGKTLTLIKEMLASPIATRAWVLLLATLFASANWLINIMGVNNGHVVELSLGTFLTPIATMTIGLVFFSEKVSRLRQIAIAFAVLGVAVLIGGLDRFPWYALSVSVTWATYGALKKLIVIDPMKSVAIEHLLMFFPALAFLSYGAQGLYWGRFESGFETGLSWYLLGTGIVTSVPMILFSLAAQKLPMTVLGIIQFLSPVITFFLGIFVFQEVVTRAECLALACILVAVSLYVIGGLKKA